MFCSPNRKNKALSFPCGVLQMSTQNENMLHVLYGVQHILICSLPALDRMTTQNNPVVQYVHTL